MTLEINDAFIGLANAGFSSDPSADYYISAAYLMGRGSIMFLDRGIL